MQDRKPMRWLADEFSYIGKTEGRPDGEIFMCDVLGRPRQEISFGAAMDTAASLSPLQRQLYESREWVFHSGILLKQRCPVAQALDGDWGHDWTQGDLPEVLERLKDHPEAIEWLKERGLHEQMRPSEDDAIAHSEFGLSVVTDLNDDEEEETDDPTELDVQEVEFGYSIPRDKYEAVEKKWRISFKEAAARREKYFKQMVEEIWRLGTNSSFVEANAPNPARDVERFMDRIRGPYQEDQELHAEWGEEEKQFYRNLYMQFLRAQKRIAEVNGELVVRHLDEEDIRRKLFIGFDAERRETWDIFTDGKFFKNFRARPSDETLRKNNSIAVPGKPTKASFWERCKSNAYTELNLTAPQWRKVYELAWNKLTNSIILMAKNANTFEQRYEVRCLVKKYKSKLGGEKAVEKILKSMPKKIQPQR